MTDKLSLAVLVKEVSALRKKKGLLSWIRGEETEPDFPTPLPITEATSEREEGPVPKEAVSPETELKLPRDHALQWLWELRSAEVGKLPSPRLSLMRTEEAAGPPPGELARLERWITAAASDRRRAIVSGAADGKLPDLDAAVMVYLSLDRLSAWVLVWPPVSNGQELTQEMLARALEREKVVLGVDHHLLTSLPDREDRYFQFLPVAQGVPPAHGKDGSIVELFPRKTERKLVVNAQGQVDFTALDLVQNVAKGVAICKIVPPTSGTPGASVQGEVLPARDGKKPVVPKGRNTELSEDGALLLAAADGHVEFTGRFFEVRCTLDIAGDVDYTTGDLNYLGDIHIHGDVRSGFTVRAMGHVRVDGVIEDTSVEAGGDLIVGGGIQGNGKAVIRAHQDVYVKYMEHCKAYIKGELHSNCIINCQVYCDGAVYVTTGRGVILGGNTYSAQEAAANVVGARTEVRTVIALGGQPCEDCERREVLREIQEMERDLERTERQPNSPAREKRLSDLRLKTAIDRMKLEQFKQKLAQRQARPEDIRTHGHLCSKMIYPGTVISIDGCTQVVQQEVRACTAVLMDEEVRFI